jgi:hypothetical protein
MFLPFRSHPEPDRTLGKPRPWRVSGIYQQSGKKCKKVVKIILH